MIIFDTSFIHETSNESEEDRSELIYNIDHHHDDDGDSDDGDDSIFTLRSLHRIYYFLFSTSTVITNTNISIDMF